MSDTRNVSPSWECVLGPSDQVHVLNIFCSDLINVEFVNFPSVNVLTPLSSTCLSPSEEKKNIAFDIPLIHLPNSNSVQINLTEHQKYTQSETHKSNKVFSFSDLECFSRITEHSTQCHWTQVSFGRLPCVFRSVYFFFLFLHSWSRKEVSQTQLHV